MKSSFEKIKHVFFDHETEEFVDTMCVTRDIIDVIKETFDNKGTWSLGRHEDYPGLRLFVGYDGTIESVVFDEKYNITRTIIDTGRIDIVESLLKGE